MSHLKHVVHLSSVHQPFDTRIFHKECKSLAKAGYNVSLIVQHEKEETVDGIHIIPVPPQKGKLLRMLKTSYNVYKKAISQKADLYHIHDPELLPYGYLLKRKGFRVIYDVHENVPLDILAKEYIPSRLRKTISYLIGKFEISISKNFDHIIAVLPEIADRFPGLNKTVIKNYPDLSSVGNNERSWDENSEHIITYIGNITEVRGASEMIKSINLVAKTRKITFLLAGTISPESLLSELKKLDGWEHTKYLGWVNRDKVKEILTNASVGLVILKKMPNNSGGLSTKLLEYLAFGVPVVASDFPLYREIIEKSKSGFTVDPDDIHQISNAIIWLLDHLEEAGEMGKRGRDYVLNHMTWNTEKEKLLNVYKSLLSE